MWHKLLCEVYKLKYGESETHRLLQLDRKERAKRISLIETFGNAADLMASLRYAKEFSSTLERSSERVALLALSLQAGALRMSEIEEVTPNSYERESLNARFHAIADEFHEIASGLKFTEWSAKLEQAIAHADLGSLRQPGEEQALQELAYHLSTAVTWIDALKGNLAVAVPLLAAANSQTAFDEAKGEALTQELTRVNEALLRAVHSVKPLLEDNLNAGTPE